MTLVGTVKAIKREIPNVVKEKKNWAPGSKAFLFTDEMTLVSYFPNTATAKKMFFFCLLCTDSQQLMKMENQKLFNSIIKPKEALTLLTRCAPSSTAAEKQTGGQCVCSLPL